MENYVYVLHPIIKIVPLRLSFDVDLLQSPLMHKVLNDICIIAIFQFISSTISMLFYLSHKLHTVRTQSKALNQRYRPTH